MRDGERAVGEVEADGPHGRKAELALLVDGVGTVERLARTAGEPGLLHAQGLGDEVLEEALQIGKDAVDVGHAVAGIVLVHQRVIGGQAQGLAAQLGLFAHQRDDAFEGGQEAVPVAARTQLAPQLFGAHGGGGAALDEFGRQAGGVDIAALELGQGELLVGVEILGLGGLDEVGDFGSGGLGVVHAGQIGHGLGALVAAAHGHMGGLVGTEDGKGVLERFELAAEAVEFGESHGGLRIRARGFSYPRGRARLGATC